MKNAKRGYVYVSFVGLLEFRFCVIRLYGQVFFYTKSRSQLKTILVDTFFKHTFLKFKSNFFLFKNHTRNM